MADSASPRRLLVVPGSDLDAFAAELAARLEGDTAIVLAAEQVDFASGDRAQRIATAMIALERLGEECRPSAVLIHGDGDEVLAAALVFSKLELPLAKLDAGETAGPEEALAERLCDLLLCADRRAAERLRRAGVGANARVVTAAGSDAAVQALAAWLLDAAP